MRPIESILVIGFGGKGVGDQIIATPFIRNLALNFPEAKIDFAASSLLGVELLRSDPHLRDCFCLDMDCFKLGGRRSLKEKISCITSLRSKKYDRAYLLNTKLRAAIAAFISGASERIGFCSYHREFLLTRHWNDPAEKNLVDRFLDLLALDGLKVERNHIRLYLDSCETAAAEAVLESHFADHRPVVALAPFAADMRRTWGLERFLDLAGLCAAEGWGVVLLGSAADRNQLEHVRLEPGIANLVGKMTIRESAALISRVSAFAGNDSGLAHVAGAVETPGIVIGYHVTKVWYPVSPTIQTVIRDPGCTSCDLGKCVGSENRRPPCFTAVSVSEIFESLKLLRRK